MTFFERLRYLVVDGIQSFFLIDWSTVPFESERIVFLTGIAIFAAFSIKFLLGRKRFFRLHSGAALDMKINKERWYAKALRFVTRTLLAGAILFVLFALASPTFYEIEKKERIIEARERIDLIDVSTSMEPAFGDTKKMMAEVGREMLLSFLDLREGQGDRACLWVFSDNPYKIQDCVIDDKLYKFQAYSAPLIITKDPDDYGKPGYWIIESEGGTQLGVALQVIAEDIENNEDGNVRKRALLMVTDAVLTSNPKAELERLRRLNVIPYLFLIKEEDMSISQGTADFLAVVRSLGGRVYRIGEEEAFHRVFENFNKIESFEADLSGIHTRFLLFQKPLFIALVFAISALLLSMVTETIFTRTP